MCYHCLKDLTAYAQFCSFLTALHSKGSGELEEESSSEDEINRRARQARGRRLDDTETGGSRHR